MAFYEHVVAPFYSRSEMIGIGSFGSSHIIKDRKTNEKLIMKLVSKYNSTVIQNIRGFKCFIHPHLVYILDFLETTYFFHIIMKTLNGGNFRQRIQNLTPTLSKFYFHQMCEAVKFLHSKGILHGDLKPQNLLLKSKDTKTLLVVSDFGLNLSYGVACIGREEPVYLAPEVVNRENVFSKSADIWSLGVILLECLNGKPAFPSSDLALEGKLYFHDLNRENVLKNVKSLIKAVVVIDPKCRASINSIQRSSWMNDSAVIKEVEEIREKFK